MAGLVGVLQSLGGTRQRDGSYGFDCSVLQLGSMFGGDLDGPAVAVIAGEAVTFKSPLELAACGTIWMTDVADDDAFCQALGVALDELREQVRGALATLRRLGFKARIQSPDPRARGTITHEGHVIGVVVDSGGDLVVDTFDGELLPEGRQASMMAPDEASPDELARLLEQVCLDVGDGESTGIVAGAPGAEPALSEEELNELQAALSDDEGDGSDDGFDDDERTAAGVPLPQPRAPGPAGAAGSDSVLDVDISDGSEESGEEDVGARTATVEVPKAPPRDFDDDDDDEPPTATLTTPIARSPGMKPHVPTRRVDAVPPPAPVAPDDDDDPFDGVGEPTATRPVNVGDGRRGIADARPTVVPASHPDGDGGLLDALGDDDDGDDGDDGDHAYDNNPTSVRGPDGSSVPAAMPVAAPLAARPAAPGADDFEDDDGSGFDEATAALGAGATDDEEDGKTRALVIDADLLARLKMGDGEKPSGVRQAVSAPQADKPLTGLTTAPLRPRPAPPLDDDFDAPPTNAVPVPFARTRGEEESPSVAPTMPPADDDEESDFAAAFADGFDDGVSSVSAGENSDEDGDVEVEIDVGVREDAIVRAGASAPRQPERPDARSFADDLEVGENADGFDDGTVNGPGPVGPTAAASDNDDDDSNDDGELTALQQKAAALEEELALVRAQISELLDARLGGREPTGSSTSTARSPMTVTEHAQQAAPPRGVAGPPQPRVGDSDEGEVETAATGGFTSLPSMKSVDVHLLKASTVNAPAANGNSLLDAFDDEDDSQAVSDGVGSLHPSGFDDEDEGGDDTGAPAGDRHAGHGTPAASIAANDGDEEVVSLAALQGALKELGVIGEANETQVAASVMDFAPADDDGDGDVFGSAGGGDSLAEEGPLRGRGAEMSEEATRIRTARLSSIALVVEDDRARDRLRKHLADRFSALIEARDGQAALRLKGISAVDAIVFIRPRNDEENLATLTRLESLPHRPRILVISHDEAFDALGAVDLRLPLGQRASEVAQQVLEGLERLGIALAPAA